jgi:ATP-binding protein involved in chromosome partitioning
MTVTVADIEERLGRVEDPDLGEDIVSLGLVNSVEIDEEAGVVHIDLALGAPYSPTETAMAGEVREALSTS